MRVMISGNGTVARDDEYDESVRLCYIRTVIGGLVREDPMDVHLAFGT